MWRPRLPSCLVVGLWTGARFPDRLLAQSTVSRAPPSRGWRAGTGRNAGGAHAHRRGASQWPARRRSGPRAGDLLSLGVAARSRSDLIFEVHGGDTGPLVRLHVADRVNRISVTVSASAIPGTSTAATPRRAWSTIAVVAGNATWGVPPGIPRPRGPSC